MNRVGETESDPKEAGLFVVLAGGTHPRARIEVHDIAFAIGSRLDDCHAQLRAQWFGAPQGLHIDAWMSIDGVDGFRIGFHSDPPAPADPKLFFLHLGGYDPARFGEEHGYALTVASSAAQARKNSQRMRASH